MTANTKYATKSHPEISFSSNYAKIGQKGKLTDHFASMNVGQDYIKMLQIY